MPGPFRRDRMESEPRPWPNDTIAALKCFRPVSKAEPGAQLAAGRGMEQTRVASTAVPITLQVVAALAGAPTRDRLCAGLRLPDTYSGAGPSDF